MSLVKRGGKNVGRRGAVAAIGVAALQQLINSNGGAWVMQQVAEGAIRLSKAAINYMTSSVAPVKDISVQSAPVSTSLTLVGNRQLNGAITIKHRELIADISFTGAAVKSWVVNPAMGNTFPYLSSIARNYDKYKFNSIRFFVVSSAPTSHGSRYYLAWEPDSTDPVPEVSGGAIPSQYLMSMQHSMSTSVWQSAGITVPASNEKFTNMFPDALKDHGRIVLASPGYVSSFNLELYVEYSVRLSEPQVGDSSQFIEKTIFTDGVVNGRGAQIAVSAGVKKLLLPPGNYYVSYVLLGVGIARVADSAIGAESTKFIGSSVGTTEVHEIAMLRGSQEMTYSMNDTWVSLTKGSVIVTPLSRDAWEAMYTALP